MHRKHNIPDFTTVPFPISDPGCAMWLCHCPSRPAAAPMPICRPAAGWAKMMLGSFRFTEPPAVPVELPFPDTGRRAKVRPGGDGPPAEDEARTGPWMGQEEEEMWG